MFAKNKYLLPASNAVQDYLQIESFHEASSEIFIDLRISNKLYFVVPFWFSGKNVNNHIDLAMSIT